MKIRRRTFLTGLGSAMAGLGAAGKARAGWSIQFGALLEDPDGILDLPRDFHYTVLDQGGDLMDDGYQVPGLPDGMACFQDADGNFVLMRNHELDTFSGGVGPYEDGQEIPKEAYNPSCFGGVTRLVVDPLTGERISSNLVLVGTSRNCAGGPSPWGWLTCEESVRTGHGYVFLCDPEAERVTEPVRIPGYGRFNHEAVAIDPATNIAYLTEDRDDGCLYRFVPFDPADPFTGRLQAMRIEDRRNFDTAMYMMPGDQLRVDWVDIEDPESAVDGVRREAWEYGAARIRRGEGIWYADGCIYIVSTSGGPLSAGQIFCLVPEQDSLLLVAQATDRDVLDMPDNITHAPWGQLFVAEDGSSDNCIRSITLDGTISTFARNRLSSSELSGVCFSPDGTMMFVSLQYDHLTLAIQGPFPGWRQHDVGALGREARGWSDTGAAPGASAPPTAVRSLEGEPPGCQITPSPLGPAAVALALAGLSRRRAAQVSPPRVDAGVSSKPGEQPG